MACKYWVNDQWLTESQFKKVLNDGLLDQLITNQDFILPDFKVNKEFIKDKSGIELGPVKVAVRRKVSNQINTFEKITGAKAGQMVGQVNKAIPRENPLLVINKSNEQIKAENKRTNSKRKPNSFILITKIKGELKYGKASKDVVREILDSPVNIVENLQEGKMYMLVPSPNGLTPIWLRNSMIGETKVAEKVKLNLKVIFENKDAAQVKTAKKYVEQLLYKVELTPTTEGVGVKIKKEDGTVEDKTFNDLNELITRIVGKYDRSGNYIGDRNDSEKRTQAGLIARVNHFAINDPSNTLSNAFYANNGFITTDVYTEGGNFFNSSSFIIEAYEASAKSKEMLSAVLKDPALTKTTQEIEQNTAAQKVTTPEIKNQDTKEDESVVFNMTPESLNAFQDDVNIPEVSDEEQALIDAAFTTDILSIPVDDIDISSDPVQDANDSLNDLFDLGNPENGEDLDLDSKPRLTVQKENATNWNKEQESEWLQKKISNHLVKDNRLGSFKSIEDLQKYLPKQTYELLLEARKNGEVLHGVFTKAAVYLNENAYEGTAYHEAFHVVFNLALPLTARLDLLTEATETFKEELPENATFLQIEELLADKFMEYVQTAEASAPSLGKKIKAFFKALYRGMKLFFNSKSKVNISDVFSDIQLGIYKNKANFKNTDLSKIEPDMVKFMKTPLSATANTQLDPRVELEAMRYMEYKFFQAFEKAIEDAQAEVAGTEKLSKFHGKSDSEIISAIGVRKMFGLMLKQMLDDRAANAGKPGVKSIEAVIRIVTDNSNREVIEVKNIGGQNVPLFKLTTPLLEKFNRSIRKFNLNINLDSIKKLNEDITDETSFNDDVEGSTLEERWQKAHIEINPRDTVSQRVKRKLGSIPKMTVSNGISVPSKNMFGAPEVHSEREVFGYLGQNLTDSYSPTEMVERLKAVQGNKGFITPILNEIEKDLSFKTALYTTVASKTFQKFITIYEKDGDYQTFYSNRKGINDIIKETLIANFLADGSPMFKKHSRGFLKGQSNFESIDSTYALKQAGRINVLKNRAGKSVDGPEIQSIIKDLSEFLTENNINITPAQLIQIWNPTNKDKLKSSWNNVIKLIQDTEKVFNELANGRNPFLDLKPSDQLSSGKNKSQKNVIENFAYKLKPAMESEVILSFRNADNKTVYSIQYSNYLSKLIKSFKDVDSLNEHLAVIKDDPLLSRMPFFDQLINADGTKTSTMDELEITIFDGLARRGKSTSVEYSGLSDAEMEAVSMGAFHNQGDTTFGFYKLPIPSDSGTLPFIKFNKYTNDQIIDNLVKVAIAEVERINTIKKEPADSALRKVPNYFKNAQKFQILSFLNGKIDTDAVNEGELKELIIEHLEGEFLELHKQGLKDAGIITSFKKGPNGKIVFADGVITASQNSKSNEFYKNYLYNQYYMNTQTSTIFAGDPSFYKNTTDYQKRYKQIISPGSLPNADIVDPTYNNIIFADEYIPSATETVKGTIELVKNSNLSEAKKKELIALWESKLETSDNPDWNNATDAATFVSIDRMMQILESYDRVTPAHEAAAVRIKKGIESPSDAALFNVLKPFMFTKQYINGVEVPIQIKNSEMLLTKAFAERKDADGKYMYPKLVETYKILNEGIEKDGVLTPVDSVIFESAVKVGAIGHSLNSSGKPAFSTMEPNKDGTYSLAGDPEIITLQHSEWRIQQETPAHYEDDAGNFGTQLRQLMIADMDLDGEYTIGGRKHKGSEVAKMYQDLIVNNLESSYESVQNMFLDNDGEINYTKLVEHLKAEVEDRGLDQEYFEALELIKNPTTGKLEPTLPLYHPLIAYKAESLMNSFFKNRVTKQKINGGNMVNATSFGTSHTLKYHIDAKGNYTMEALLPWWSKKYFPKNETGDVDFNSLPEELKNIIGYRIPTEDKYSVFNIKVVGFTDSAAGGAIILPVEATTQAGLDFDIDKLFMIIPSFRINNEGKAEYIKYIDENSSKEKVAELITSSSQSYENFVDTYIPESQRESWLTKKEKADDARIEASTSQKEFDEESELGTLKKKRKELKAQRKLEQDVDSRRAISKQIRDISSEIDDHISTSASVDGLLAHLGLVDNPSLTLQNEVLEVLKSKTGKLDYSLLNNTKSRNNKLLEIMTGIMENKQTALSVVDPGNFDKLKELGSKVRILQIQGDANSNKLEIKKEGLAAIKKFEAGNISLIEYRNTLNKLADRLDNEDFNINYPLTQSVLFRRNMTGKQLIGIFANHNAHHAKAQYTSLQTNTDIFFNGNAYSKLNRVYDDGMNRISKSLASKLAAVVDNAKDPISAYLNMNTYTADLIAFMSRLGVDEDTIFAFVNQPAIVELTTTYFNDKGSMSEQQGLVGKAVRSWKSQLLSKTGISEKELKKVTSLSGAGLNLDLGELEAALDRNGTNEYYLTQYKAINAFEQYFKVSAELSAGVQATRVDTKAVGPSNGANYSMVNRQQKLLEKKEPKILGIDQMLYESSSQKMNPAFNTYGWIKPISIMNKVFPSIGNIDLSGKITYSALGKIKNFFSDLKDQNYTITEKEARDIDTNFMTFIGSSLPFFDYKNAQSVLEGTPEKLIEFKKKNPDSPFMPFLEQLYTKDADKQVDIRRIEFYTTGKTSLDNETARLVWKMMLTSEQKEAKELALDLVKYAYFSNGYSFGPFSFFNLIPVKFWTDSFANAPENKGLGLLNDKGASFNEVMKSTLKEIEDDTFDATDSILHSATINNFIKQFAQNTAEKSMIIKTVASKDASDRKYAPANQVPRVLADNEVFVFGSTNLGTHNTSDAGWAYSKTPSFNPQVGIKGTKGEWAEYGITGREMKGSSGKSFAIRTQNATVNEGRLTIDKVGSMDTEAQTKQMEKLISDLKALVATASANKGTNYIVGNLAKNTGWKIENIKAALIEVMDEVDLPNNILLPKKFEVRDFGSVEVSENQIMKLHKPSIIKYNADILVKGDQFPSFLKTSYKGEVKLFKLVSGSDIITQNGKVTGERQAIYYKRLPLLGTPNFVSEYDFNNEITESIVPKLSKKLEVISEEELMSIDTQLDIDTQLLDEIMPAKEELTKSAWVLDPADVSDVTDLATIVPSKSNPTPSKVDYSEFSKLALSKGNPVGITKEEWDSKSVDIQNTVIEQLKKC